MADTAGARAITLYVVAARDVCDFLDMLQEEETTDEALTLLRDMLASPGTKNTDVELNKLILPIVEREQERRTYLRRPAHAPNEAEKAAILDAINNPTGDEVD